jgi:hypothetical protein
MARGGRAVLEDPTLELATAPGVLVDDAEEGRRVIELAR